MLSVNEHGTRRIRQAPYGDTISRLGARPASTNDFPNSLLTKIIASEKDMYKIVAKLERSLALNSS